MLCSCAVVQPWVGQYVKLLLRAQERAFFTVYFSPMGWGGGEGTTNNAKIVNNLLVPNGFWPKICCTPRYSSYKCNKVISETLTT